MTLALLIFVLAFVITRIAERGTVIARREQALNYAILGFSLIALYLIVGIR